MRDVTLVEVHSDGEHLVLTDSSGERYRLRIDEQLRAAARRDTAWLNQLQASGRSEPLRPREIQTRIRAGMSAEQLASATGVPVENIRRYEGPVLAERQHVAELAQKVAVARTASGDTSLAEAVAERLAVREVDAEAEWDSWREDAGTWIVQASFEAGGRPRAAQWAFHPADATLEPLDDESRWLTGRPEPEPPAKNERVFDVEANGGVREKTVRQAPAPSSREPEAPAEEPADDVQARTLDLLDALRGRRGQRQPITEDSDEAPDLVDVLLEESDVAPPSAHPPASAPHEAVDAAILTLPEPPPDTSDDQQESARPEPSAPARVRRSARGSKRAPVPSWDDIMFGVKKD